MTMRGNTVWGEFRDRDYNAVVVVCQLRGMYRDDDGKKNSRRTTGGTNESALIYLRNISFCSDLYLTRR